MEALKANPNKSIPAITPDNLGEVLTKYANAHARALEQAQWGTDYMHSSTTWHPWYNELRAKTAELYRCGAMIELHQADDEIRLVSGSLCKNHKLCPLCAMRRCGRSMARYGKAIAELLDSQEHQLVPVFVTLTIRNGPDLDERFTNLADARRELMQRRRDALLGKRSEPVLESILGGVSSIEVKRGSGSGTWHPHIHAIYLLRKTKTAREHASELSETLRRHWRQIADGYIVDVRPMISETDIHKCTCEVFKYTLKFSELDPPDAFHTHFVTKGKRFLSSFGNLRGLGEPDGGEDLPFEDRAWLAYFYLYVDGDNGPEYVQHEFSTTKPEPTS